MTSLGLHTATMGGRRERALAVASADHPHNKEGARRILNVVVAAIGLVAAAPVMLAIAIVIKLTSKGPVFYKQQRVGLDLRSKIGGNYRRKHDLGGRLFTIYKFRTMRPVTSAEANQVWATQSDPRITRVGAFLRKTRLDELPQLFNVLRGEMNMVGPRPEQPRIFEELRNEVASYAVRQQVRPGITGLAQISLHYDTCIDDVRKKVAADLEYISRQSLLEDIRIMALTAPAVLLKKGGW